MIRLLSARVMPARRHLWTLACAALLAGCQSIPLIDPARGGPFYTPANITGGPRLPDEVHRVVLLPLHGGVEIDDDTLERFTAAFAAELSRTQRFEVVTARGDEIRRLTGGRRIGSTDLLPPTLLSQMASTHGAQAALFVDITTFSAYPPLSLGVRAKLVRLRDGEILWGADNLFDSAQAPVVNSARRYSLDLGSGNGAGDLSHTILQNPTRFAAYAAFSTFSALPQRLKVATKPEGIAP